MVLRIGGPSAANTSAPKVTATNVVSNIPVPVSPPTTNTYGGVYGEPSSTAPASSGGTDWVLWLVVGVVVVAVVVLLVRHK
jgi:hypothetical protein